MDSSVCGIEDGPRKGFFERGVVKGERLELKIIRLIL